MILYTVEEQNTNVSIDNEGLKREARATNQIEQWCRWFGKHLEKAVAFETCIDEFAE